MMAFTIKYCTALVIAAIIATAAIDLRSQAQRNSFLRSQGYTQSPAGYEVDHIIPLCAGGKDTPENMQLLTKEAHKAKTKIDNALCRKKQTKGVVK